jgi:hypothetical protein
MARVTGPLHSDSASGSIKGGLTYGSWKGRNYVRATVTPSNPRTAAQTGHRTLFAFIASLWGNLTAQNQATWADLASTFSITAFNAYMKENLNRWKEFLAPTQAYPAAVASAGLTVSAHTFTGGSQHATISLTPSAATSIWGFILFRSTAAIVTPSPDLVVAVIPANGVNAITHIDSNLTAGTYHYRACVINVDGTMGTVLADDTAVVTA